MLTSIKAVASSSIEEPSDEDCCHNGCNPCVFDVYEKYLQNENNFKNEPVINHEYLSPTKFKRFTLIKRSDVSDKIKIFRFQPFMEDSVDKIFGQLPIKPGQHLVLSSKPYENESCKEFVNRKYSVISDSSQENKCCFEVIVKLYLHGKMSNYLNSLKVGDVSLWRGPYGNFFHQPNSFKYILMLAMGTGIAPLYSVSNSILKDENDDTVIKLFAAFRSFDDILLREELKRLSSFWNFKMKYFFSSQLDDVHFYYHEKYQCSKITSEVLRNELSDKIENTQVLISGSEQFEKDMSDYVFNICGLPEKNIYIF